MSDFRVDARIAGPRAAITKRRETDQRPSALNVVHQRTTAVALSDHPRTRTQARRTQYRNSFFYIPSLSRLVLPIPELHYQSTLIPRDSHASENGK